MTKLQLAQALLLLFVTAASAAGQAIPVHIPDLPGESPADREREHLEERYRGTLSRLFSTGSFGVAAATRTGAAYQTNLQLGLSFHSGDAAFVFVSRRQALAGIEDAAPLPHTVLYYGAGYEVSATRFFGESPLAERGALNLGLGVIPGSPALAAVEVAPTYEIFHGDFWSMPAGLKLSLARMVRDDVSVTSALLGFTIGVRRHFGRREKLESRSDR